MEKEQVAGDEAVETVAEQNARAYSKTVWNESTPITADKLNKIENGIANALDTTTGGTVNGKLTVKGHIQSDGGNFYSNKNGGNKPVIEVFDGDKNGSAVVYSGGALTVLAGGESGSLVVQNTNNTEEYAVVSADQGVILYANLQNGWENRKTVELTKGGRFKLNNNALELSPNNSGYARIGIDGDSQDVFISNINNNWFRLKGDKTITYGGHKVYTAFDKPTAGEIGALPMSGGTLTGKIDVSGESTFSQGAYVDPWHGQLCAIKATGHIASTATIRGTTLQATGNGKTLTLGTGGSDVYIHNTSSGKYLQLKDDGTLRYSDSLIYHEGNSGGPVSGNWFSGGFPRVGGNGVMEIGKYIDFHNANNGTEDYSVRLCVDANNKNTVYLPNDDGRLYNTGNHGCKRLAQGAYYMTGSQSVGLTDTVWNQAHGIVLVFSAYNPSSGQAYNFDWHTYFVPKTFFTDRESAEGYALITTFLTNPTLTNIGTKHIRVYNNRVTGDDRNIQSGSGSGISFRNTEWVLRYVYGV